MWFSIKTPLALLAAAASMTSTAAAERLLRSESLNSCQADSGFSASLFNVVFTASNNTAAFNIAATSSINSYVKFDASIALYGYNIAHIKLDPCELKLAGLCPMTTGKLNIKFNLQVDPKALEQVPTIGYYIPDIDANVKVYINETTKGADKNSLGRSLACVSASISNGKTVDLTGVKWATALIAGFALISSAIVNGLGQYNTAAHVAANALALFGYFQAQAIVGLTSVRLPPIVAAWTQDFQWSMGIIHVPFMQDIFTWYQRATGGAPSTIFDTLVTQSVQVEKRSLDLFQRGAAMLPRAVNHLAKRGNIVTGSGSYIVYGIQRVAFKAKIESTNLFMTGLIFFVIVVVFTIIGVAAFKAIVEALAKKKTIKPDRFLEFRNGWVTILKGILFRIALLGFAPICILSMWELTQRDSPAEVVLAIFFFIGIVATLGWGAGKVIRIARRSVAMHQNPAYILFSDPQALNKWGFLYMQFRASAYYFIAPVLAYSLLKSILVAFAQGSGKAQAVAFVVLEAGALVGASVMRPWMDKPTNSFNIAICAINFINAVFLLIFSDVFGAPALVIGVVGVVLFIVNVIFAIVLLIMVIVSATVSFFRKNPDARYQYMADDRASFMKSQTQINTTNELDALAVTARGDKSGYKAHVDLDDDVESLHSDRRDPFASPAASQHSFHAQGNGPRSPVNPSMPLFPANGSRPESPFRSTANSSPSPYGNNRPQQQQQSFAAQQRAQAASPAPGYRNQNNSSPWQRGAGYDH